jgi:DNA-directed RNA polymerase subunit L
MQFSQVVQKDARTYTFTLSNSHVTYANTLRRLMLTGVETIAFRSDMTSTGTTSDVTVKRNDTPMTNEMLADRIGLLPIHVKEPNAWKENNYTFILSMTGEKDKVTYVKSEHFVVSDGSHIGAIPVDNDEEKKEEPRRVPTEMFFPKNPLTNDTCLIASLQPGSGSIQQAIEIVAKASKGTGREHARFCPVSQCTYEYTPDSNPERIQEMFLKWLAVAKKVTEFNKESERYKELWREFNTMQVKRCFLLNEKGEPFSFNFTVESVGVLDVPYIVNRACEVGENICSRYVNMQTGKLPDDVIITPSDSRIFGFDFLFQKHDHTLGNLLQTWLVEHHIEGEDKPEITYAGYSVPHPLRDEMILRVGIKDGEESVARLAVAMAARGCQAMFQNLRVQWNAALGTPLVKKTAPTIRKPRIVSAAI